MKTVQLGRLTSEIYRYPSYYGIEYTNSGVPEVRGEMITKSGTLALDQSKWRFISKDTAERFPRTSLSENDLVMSVRGTIGKLALVPSELDGANITANLLRISLDQLLVNPRYFWRFCRSPEFLTKLNAVSPSTTIKTIRIPDFRAIPIPLPPLAEQERIARVLDAADALRATRRASLAQLDTLLQATFLDLFGDPVTNPKGWEISSLREVCLGKPSYGSGAASCDYDSSLPRYVRITDVDDAGNLSDDPRCAQLSGEDVEKYRLHEGDVLLARSGATVGKSYLYRAEHGFCVYAGYMIRFRLDPNILLPEVLFRFTQTSAYWRWVESNSRTVAQPNINAKIYSSLPVTRPPLDLQRRFATIVESVEHQKATQRAHLAELDTLFASLQARAFRGDL